MQAKGPGKPPLGVIFDTALDERIDQAMAVSTIYGLEASRDARLASLSVSRYDLRVAAFCDLISRFHAGGGRAVLPIGIPATGTQPAAVAPMISAVLDKQGPDGKPLYTRGIQQVNDTADVAALIRNAISSQQPDNSVVVLAGPASNIAHALALQGSRELFAKRVKLLTIALGSYPNAAEPDADIKQDIAAARKLLAEWPTPIVAVGSEVGAALPFPSTSFDKDFAWAANHPVVDAYRASKPAAYDVPSTAMLAALYAVRPESGAFKLSAPGTITITDDGRTHFTPAANGNHHYVIAIPEQKDQTIKMLVELASVKTPTRSGRGGPPNQEKAAPPAQEKAAPPAQEKAAPPANREKAAPRSNQNKEQNQK